MSAASSILLAYLIGSIPFALMLSRLWGLPNLRRIGSGNLGATNVFRASGPTAGLLVAMLDVGKGAVSVLLAERLNGPGVGVSAAAGFAAIAGHVYPLWLRFRGGKGVATACGVFAVLAPVSTLIALATFTCAVWLTGYVSVGSVAASVMLPPMAYALESSMSVVVAAGSAASLIVFRHRSNLMRVRVGTERRLGARI